MGHSVLKLGKSQANWDEVVEGGHSSGSPKGTAAGRGRKHWDPPEGQRQ